VALTTVAVCALSVIVICVRIVGKFEPLSVIVAPGAPLVERSSRRTGAPHSSAPRRRMVARNSSPQGPEVAQANVRSSLPRSRFAADRSSPVPRRWDSLSGIGIAVAIPVVVPAGKRWCPCRRRNTSPWIWQPNPVRELRANPFPELVIFFVSAAGTHRTLDRAPPSAHLQYMLTTHPFC